MLFSGAEERFGDRGCDFSSDARDFSILVGWMHAIGQQHDETFVHRIDPVARAGVTRVAIRRAALETCAAHAR